LGTALLIPLLRLENQNEVMRRNGKIMKIFRQEKGEKNNG
jgi:hypothetical protein